MIERWSVTGGQLDGYVPPPHAVQLHGGGASGSEPAGEPAEAGRVEEMSGGAQPKRGRSRWGRRIGWFAAMVAMGGVVAAVIIVCMKFIDGPVVTTQTTTLAHLQATPAAVPSMSLWSGTYVELKYPDIFNQLGAAPGNKSALEAYNFSSKNSYGRQIALSVMKLPSGKLDDDSSYKFRSINPGDYKSKNVVVMGEPAVEMIKTDGLEQTFFWAHKGMLLTISATTDNPVKDKLATYLAQIEPTIRWR